MRQRHTDVLPPPLAHSKHTQTARIKVVWNSDWRQERLRTGFYHILAIKTGERKIETFIFEFCNEHVLFLFISIYPMCLIQTENTCLVLVAVFRFLSFYLLELYMCLIWLLENRLQFFTQASLCLQKGQMLLKMFASDKGNLCVQLCMQHVRLVQSQWYLTAGCCVINLNLPKMGIMVEKNTPLQHLV